MGDLTLEDLYQSMKMESHVSAAVTNLLGVGSHLAGLSEVNGHTLHSVCTPQTEPKKRELLRQTLEGLRFPYEGKLIEIHGVRASIVPLADNTWVTYRARVRNPKFSSMSTADIRAEIQKASDECGVTTYRVFTSMLTSSYTGLKWLYRKITNSIK